MSPTSKWDAIDGTIIDNTNKCHGSQSTSSYFDRFYTQESHVVRTTISHAMRMSLGFLLIGASWTSDSTQR